MVEFGIRKCVNCWCLSLALSMTIIIAVCDAHVLRSLQSKPPPAKYQYNRKALQVPPSKFQRKTALLPDSEEDGNIWEESGLFEGDIMTYGGLMRNGISSEERRWPNATVPYYIDDSFSNEDTELLIGAMQEYHDRTCVRFRPYTREDSNWIELRSDFGGCWSSVGMREEGQVVNLNAPRCIRHGVIVHELMHALGFFHEQSSSDRDEHVTIMWDNIREGRETNFKKYNNSAVNNFGVGYDYDSVMHYSSKAFSKNGKKTIEPIDPNAKVGQRVGLSDKDVRKVNAMYADTCHLEHTNVLEGFEIEPDNPETDDILTQLQGLFENFIL